MKGVNMVFDDAVLQCFLEKQGQLFPEKVAESLEEADNFLEESMAVVVNSVKEVWEYFDEAGVDMEGADEEEILQADEVFEVGDGRYLIIE
ncbi:MAG: glyoxalase [Ruminococcus sp.]|nr:glyoxalase [Ruminococcus sp.]